MKRLQTILFFLLIGLQCFAQNDRGMSVVSFRSLQNDMTANRRDTERRDRNRRLAALIKIVTPEKGFQFDGGSLGIVDTKYMPGEVWLYVPERAQKLTIAHDKYGVLREYYYTEAIEGGRTYELVLDLGVGRFMTYACGYNDASVFLDGDSIGLSPITQLYTFYGKHHIKCVKGKLEGEMDFEVMPEGTTVINVEMQDMSRYYHNVTISVPDNAEIYYEGQQKAVGAWRVELKEGSYQIETRKAGCEPSVSVVNVTNDGNTQFTVDAPVPFHGYLRVHTVPVNTEIKCLNHDGVAMVPDENKQLNVGSYLMEFSRKGYISREKEYSIHRDEQTNDTIVLQPIVYIKPTTFYLAAGATYSSLIGATVTVGATIMNIDAEVHYTLGLTSTKYVNWYDATTHAFASKMSYKLNTIGGRVGYQVLASSHFSFTPQLGYCSMQYSGTNIEGSKSVADAASTQFITIGCKAVYAPTPHFRFYVTPEFAFASGEKDAFKKITECAGLASGGFAISAGLMFNF